MAVSKSQKRNTQPAKAASPRAKPARLGRKVKNVIGVAGDNLSFALDNLVPEQFRDTDSYLNVVQWNIEWFGAKKSIDKDKQRWPLILKILGSLNADLYVFQEVAGPSKDGRYPGVLDAIAEELTSRGVGDYVVYYTKAGGEQRVALMWDRDWVRAKTDIEELFQRGTHLMPDGKDAFAGRTPLYGHFTAATVPHDGGGTGKFDFQVLGVHLKAMAEGAAARLASAKVLAEWLKKDAPKIDSDTMIMGDWNAPPDDPCWQPIHAMESDRTGGVAFRQINDPSDFSYLWLRNRKEQFVSRIDLTAMTLSSMAQVSGPVAQVVRWGPLEETIARAAALTDKEVVAVMKQLKELISDHMPTVTRFFFKPA